MIVHNNLAVSKIYHRVLSAPEKLSPILIQGTQGTGRFLYHQALVRELSCQTYSPFKFFTPETFEYSGTCDCTICQKILERKTPDLLILDGTEGIQEVRETVIEFAYHNPVELRFRYLLCCNIERFSKEIFDTLLKILEEPPADLKVLATSTDLTVAPPAILSRFKVFTHGLLSSDQINFIIDHNPRLKIYSSLIDKFNFISMIQLIVYRRLDFESKFQSVFTSDNSVTLRQRILALIAEFKAQKISDLKFEDILDLFLEFYISRIREYCKLNESVRLQIFEQYFNRILSRFGESLFKYLKLRNVALYINTENQLISFFTAILSLRKIIEV